MRSKSKSFLFLAILVLPTLAFSQYKYKKFTFIGLDVGVKNEFYQITDAGNELYAKNNFRNSITGIFIEQELNRWLSASSGVYFTNYSVDFRFKRDNGFNVFKPMKTTLIPARLHFNFPVFYGIPEVRLAPQFGMNIVFNRTNEAININGKIAPDLDSDNYSGTIFYNLKNNYFLAEGGLNIDLLFAKGLMVSVGGRYFQGFQDVAKVDLSYRIGREINEGTLSSKGSFYTIHTSMKYPISRYWNKKSKKRK